MGELLGAHHTHDGLYFARREDGAVFVWMHFGSEDVTPSGRGLKRSVLLQPNEWESVVREMSGSEAGGT